MTTPPDPYITVGQTPDDTQYAPDPFMEPDPNFPTPILNQTVPGSEGGLIEAVKRAITAALRDAVTKTTLATNNNDSEVTVNLEYPMTEEQYPGIWVQFSLTDMKRAGLSQEFWIQDEEQNWMPMQEWIFNGRVTLTVVALSNKERDRISDAFISMFAFARTPDVVLRDPTKDTQQYRTFLTYLDESPYVSLTVNTDTLAFGGQQGQMGLLPWQSDIMVYEDSYMFDLLGSFNILFRNDGWYTLHRIDIDAQPGADNVEYDPSQWRGGNGPGWGQYGTAPPNGAHVSHPAATVSPLYNPHVPRPAGSPSILQGSPSTMPRPTGGGTSGSFGPNQQPPFRPGSRPGGR